MVIRKFWHFKQIFLTIAATHRRYTSKPVAVCTDRYSPTQFFSHFSLYWKVYYVTLSYGFLRRITNTESFDILQVHVTSFLEELDWLSVWGFLFVSMRSTNGQITTNRPAVFISYVKNEVCHGLKIVLVWWIFNTECYKKTHKKKDKL